MEARAARRYWQLLFDDPQFRRDRDVPQLDAATKRQIIDAISERFDLDGEQRTLFDISARTTASLAECFMGNKKQLTLPVSKRWPLP